MPKIEGDGKSWLRRPKLYKGVVEPYKKKIIILWDYCRIYCPSLTETSLSGAYLYFRHMLSF